MKNKIFILLIILCISFTLFSAEAGMFAGIVNNPSKMAYGFTGVLGIIIPFTSIEVEYGKFIDTDIKNISVSLRIKKKLGKIAPYFVLGVGTNFDKITFNFSEYDNYSLIGGGIYLFLIDFMSLRFDFRNLHYSEINRFRISAGLYFHL